MAVEMTAEEVLQEYVGAMGPELGNVFFGLRNDCITLHWKWEEFVALFGTNPERVELLNKSAGAFFRLIQDTLWADVLLRIARLSDPTDSGKGKNNLTLLRLRGLVATPIQARVESVISECLAKTEFARDWRNRRIAHSDLALALDHPTAVPLAPATRKSVKEALEAIVALLNVVQLYYLRSEAMYVIEPRGNARSLLYVLRDGLKAEADRMERMRKGTYTKDDISPRPRL